MIECSNVIWCCETIRAIISIWHFVQTRQALWRVVLESRDNCWRFSSWRPSGMTASSGKRPPGRESTWLVFTPDENGSSVVQSRDLPVASKHKSASDRWSRWHFRNTVRSSRTLCTCNSVCSIPASRSTTDNLKRAQNCWVKNHKLSIKFTR